MIVGLDRAITALDRLDHGDVRERAVSVEQLVHLDDVVALDHLPAIAAAHEHWRADPSHAAVLRQRLHELRAAHDANAQREAERAFFELVHRSPIDREALHTLARRWPLATRARVDHRALERWLATDDRDAAVAACELAMSWNDLSLAAPRLLEGALGVSADLVTLASAWAACIAPSFGDGAWRSTMTRSHATFLPPGEDVLVSGAFALSTRTSSWFEGPGDLVEAWSAMARFLGLGPRAWAMIELRGEDDELPRLLLRASVDDVTWARLSRAFEGRSADGMPATSV